MINDKITDVAMKLVMQNNTLLHIQSCNRNNEWLEYNNKETIYIHYNGNEYLKKKNEIHSTQGWAAATRHGVTKKRSTERLEHTGNLFRKNLQLIGVC